MLTSRVHPGESMVSYLIEYMIDYLIGNSVEAKILRENFVFYIVPMLNIDGVINGNYRCNLAGFDLNRQYINPTKQQHPTIYNLKNVKIINSLSKNLKTKRISLFCVICMAIHAKKTFLCVILILFI